MDKDSSIKAYQEEYDAFGIRQTSTPLGMEENGQVSNVATNPVNPKSITSGQMSKEISLVRGFLQSSNFITGSTGWQINADGDVEFNDGVFRGTITASQIYSGFLSTDPVGSTGERVVIDNADNTISFYNSSNAVVAQLGGGTLIGTALRVVLDTVTAVGVRVDSAHASDIGFQYVSSGNYAQAGVNIQMTGATNSGIGININHDGSTGEGVFVDISAGAKGVLIQNTGAGNSLEIQSSSGESIFINHTADGTKAIELIYSGRQDAVWLESDDTSNGDSTLYITGNQSDASLTHGILELERTSVGTSLYIHQSLNTSSNAAAIVIDINNSGAGLMHAFAFEGSEHVSAAVGGSQSKKIRVFIDGSTYYIPCYDS